MMKLRLYVQGQGKRSAATIQAVQEAIASRGDIELEVVDLFQQTELVMQDNVRASPTLVRLSPEPQERVVGNLTESKVLSLIDVPKP